MQGSSFCIIGTAGRKEDGKRLTADHYSRMVNATKALISHLQLDLSELHLCSGGAAWADHVPVTLVKQGFVPPIQLTVFMPTSLGVGGYIGRNDRELKTSSTANYYHQVFSQITGINSLGDLLDVKSGGAHLVAGNGSFHARNSDVANDCTSNGHLLAFTFGSPLSNQPPWTIREHAWNARADECGLKDGGTADTWNKAGCRKFHCRLGDNQ